MTGKMVRFDIANPNHLSAPSIVDDSQIEHIFEDLKNWSDILKDSSLHEENGDDERAIEPVRPPRLPSPRGPS